MSPLDQSYRPSVLVGLEPSPLDRYLEDEIVSCERVSEVIEWRARRRVPEPFSRAFARDDNVAAH